MALNNFALKHNLGLLRFKVALMSLNYFYHYIGYEEAKKG